MTRPGHTLTELLVVLSILSLFSLVAAPRFGEVVDDQRLDAAVRMLREDLAFARVRSLSTGLRHQLQFDPESGDLYVQAFHPENQEQGSDATGQTGEIDVVHRSTLHPDVRLVYWRVSPLGYGETATASSSTTDVFTAYAEGVTDSAELVVEGINRRRRALRLDGFLGRIEEVDPATILQ